MVDGENDNCLVKTWPVKKCNHGRCSCSISGIGMGIHSYCCFTQFIIARLDGSHRGNITLLYMACECSGSFLFFFYLGLCTEKLDC